MKRLLPFFFALLALPALADERLLRSFAVEHRAAEEMAVAIRPHLAPGDSMSIDGNRLLIRSDLATLADIETLLGELDQAPVQLLISVRQTPRLAATEDNRRHYTTRSARELSQQLRGEPDRWIGISQGEEIPVGKQSSGEDGESKTQSIEYKTTASGFEVRVRLLGDGRVQIEARPFMQRPHVEGGGRIETQQMISRISGPLGEWLELGGPLPPAAGQNQRHYSSELESRQGYRTLIRIERID